MRTESGPSSQRILIVEDERLVALNLQQRLSKLGYEVVGRAACGKQAIAKAVATHPDLVLMDIHIEGDIDGIQTAELLYAQCHLRVVYLTAYSEDASLERAKATKPYGYVLKPFCERDLHATLQMALERRQTDMALSESEQRGRLALETAAMGSWEFLPARGTLRAFGRATELLGGQGRSQAIALEAALASVHEDDREAVRAFLASARSQDHPRSIEFRQPTADLPVRWVKIVMRAFEDESDAEPRLIGVAQDVTERHLVESRLRQAATVFDETQEGLFILDGQRRLISVNPAFTAMTGIDHSTGAGSQLPFLSRKMLPEATYTAIWEAIQAQGHWDGEVRASRASGALFAARLSLSRVQAVPQDDAQLVGIVSDFTELRRAQESLHRMAHHDPLTDLPNRLLMQDRLQQALHRVDRRGGRVAVLFVDLDHFKWINDSHGHAFGDLVLREAASRLQDNLRGDDTAARLGGDEFVVLMEGFDENHSVITVAEKIQGILTSPFDIAGQTVELSASIGIAIFPEDGQNVDQLLQCADTAMYAAKNNGRNRYAFYDPQMSQRAARHMAQDQRIRQALENGELRLHYQPQIDIRTGQWVAAEALLRWQHPQRGLLDAGAVIPQAEQSGLIVDIGRWVLRQACAQLRRWEQAGLGALRIAVNVSPRQILSGTLSLDVSSALGAFGVDPARLELEITESALQTESLAVATLQQIRQLGARIAIDDFGTGYSCLASLKHLPLDQLKIDRSFVQELPGDKHSVALAQAILAVSNLMELEVVAEGVETQAQLAFLRQHGCQIAQGWLFGRAVPAQELPGLLGTGCGVAPSASRIAVMH